MRILGIDLGTTSIKAVEIDSAFGRYEVHEYYDHKIEQGEDPRLAITRLMQALQKQPDRIAIAVPGRHMTFRNLRLPTRDRKAIQAGIGFELEDELPFPLERGVYDYSLLSQGKQGSEIHVATTLKRHIAEIIEYWAQAGVDPDVITTESWAYRNYLNRVLPATDQEEPVLLADIGSARTTIYVHWRGSPILSREIAWGGNDLTRAIAKKYNLLPDQAEAAKLDHGFVVPESQQTEVTTEQREFSSVLMEPLRELISELKQAELTCKSLTHRNLTRIYVSGGSVLLPGLARVLEEQSGIPVRPLQALSAIAASGVTYSEASDAAFLLAASVALTQVGTDRAAMINFRKGEFAKAGQVRKFDFATLRRPLLAGGAIALSLIVSMMIESRIYASRIQEVDTQLERGMKTFFGSISGSAIRTYLSNTATLKTNINKELNKQRELSKLVTPNPRSPLEFLKTLSSRVPKDAVVDMMQFQVGAAPSSPFSSTAEQTVSLTFLMQNPQTADRIADVLGRELKNMQKGKLEETAAADGTKRWKITFTGKPLEEAYGK